ncbi:MAG: molybdopterin-binding protein, partial [Alphaproteobacteria bacterium]
MNKRMKFISLNIGIITISDTRSEENDKSGKVLYDAIIDSKHNVFNKIIIPDNIDQIRECIISWIKTNNVDVIISTGGTGLTGKDITPEAVEPLLEKKIDGFSSLFHQIMRTAIVGIGIGDVEKIDSINILNATKYAMNLSVERLDDKPDLLLIDGNFIINNNTQNIPIISGDTKS